MCRSFVRVLCLFLLLCGFTEQNGGNIDVKEIGDQLNRFFPQFDKHGLEKVISGLMLNKKLQNISNIENILTTQGNLSVECSQALTDLIAPALKYLKNRDIEGLTKWLLGSELLLYIDSWGKLPSRVFLGNVGWYGGYDECQQIPSTHYCLSDMVLLNQSVLLDGYYGTCVPKKCSMHDVRQMLHSTNYYVQKFVDFPSNGTMTKLFGSPTICNDKRDLRADTIICISLCVLLAVLCLVGTIIDALQDLMTPDQLVPKLLSVDYEYEYTEDDEERNKNFKYKQISSVKFPLIRGNRCTNFFICFSLIKNVKSLFSTTVSDGVIGSLNGIRTISITWVILGHTYVFALGAKLDNTVIALKVVENFSFQAIANAYVSVDTFFLLSGTLVTYLSLKKMDKTNGKLNILMMYLHRFIRLTPSYMFVIFVYKSLFPFTMDSPQGMLQRFTVDDPCEKYWWTNLLYINNFYPMEMGKECLAWSWYLANDMQFFIISPLFLFIMYRFKLYGSLLSIISGIGISITITGALIGYYDLASLLTETIASGGESAQKVTMFADDIYVKPYTRISPYLLGMLLGYILSRKVSIGERFIRMKIFFGWTFAIVIGMLVVYGPYSAFKHDGKPFTTVENVFYGSFSRFAWGIALAWVIYACHHNFGGIVDKFLSWKLWVPLSRLTYGVYLWHPIVIMYCYISNHNSIHFQGEIVVFNFLAITVLSFGMATLSTLCIDYPVTNLEKKLFKQ